MGIQKKPPGLTQKKIVCGGASPLSNYTLPRPQGSFFGNMKGRYTDGNNYSHGTIFGKRSAGMGGKKKMGANAQ